MNDVSSPSDVVTHSPSDVTTYVPFTPLTLRDFLSHPIPSDGEDADGTDDEEKRERVLGKVKVPAELDGRMKANLFYTKQVFLLSSLHVSLTL